MDKLARLNLVSGLPKIKFENDHLCSTCEVGKLKRATHKTKSDMSYTKPLQMLHVDLCGPISVQSLSGKKYILVLVDDFSRFTWVEFVRKKYEVPNVLNTLLKKIHFYECKIKMLISDNGTEFKNSVIESYFLQREYHRTFLHPNSST